VNIASSYFVGCDFCGEFVCEIGELFLSGTTIADIEFNTEILMRTTWIVRSSENESTNAIQLQVEIEMSDISGNSGSRHETFLSNMNGVHTLSDGNLND